MRLVAGLALLLAAPAAAQAPGMTLPPPPESPPPLPASPAPKPATVTVVLTTTAGPITIALEKERAPITTANFLHYVDTRRFDGIGFYRAVKVAPGFGLVQGGIRDDVRKLYPAIPLEPTSKTGLSHVDGAIAMAREAPDSAQADFFVVVGNFPSMDADPSKSGDNQGFAVFGRVTDGMDVVRAQLDAPRSITTPRADMQGQILATPLKIISARRVP